MEEVEEVDSFEALFSENMELKDMVDVVKGVGFGGVIGHFRVRISPLRLEKAGGDGRRGETGQPVSQSAK